MVNLDEGKRHEKWLNPTNQRVTSVPRHRKAIPTGTLHAILKQLGLTLDDLLNP